MLPSFPQGLGVHTREEIFLVCEFPNVVFQTLGFRTTFFHSQKVTLVPPGPDDKSTGFGF